MKKEITAQSLRELVNAKNEVINEILESCKSASEKGSSSITFRKYVGVNGFSENVTSELERLGFTVKYFEECKQFVDQYVVVSWES